MGLVATLSIAGVVIWWINTGDENERKRAA
jgi:hypothetical protein